MPYLLEHKKGKGYKLHLKDDLEHVFSKKYQSKKKAQQQMQAIEISKKKRLASKIEGGGILDKIKRTVNSIIGIPTTIASKLIPETTRYTNKTEENLNRYGNFQILNLTIEKQPVEKEVMYLANTLSALELQGIMQKAGIDKFYHLSLKADVLTATDTNISLVIEKNENIVVDIYKPRPNTQSLKVDLGDKKITIRDLLEKTRIDIGNDHFFLYRWDSWNCADFILEILKANDLYKPEYRDFIWQNADIIKRNMSSASRNRMHLITKLGSFIKRLKGGSVNFI